MKPRMFALLPVVLLSLAVVACAAGGQAPPAPTAAEGGGALPTSVPLAQPTSAPAASGGSLDFDSIDVCQILPRAELAALAGGTPYEGAEEGGSICIYTIDPGDGTAELYSIGVFEPGLIQATIDYVREYEQAEWLEGIGTAAYIQASSLGEGYDMSVVVEGAYGLSLSGVRPEVLQDIARLLVERLGE